MQEEIKLTGYDIKAKEKNVEILNPVIKRTTRGAYMVTGRSAAGNPISTLVNQQKAFDAIRAGIATADGFELPDENQEAGHD